MVAVLFLPFNRPKTAKQVIEALLTHPPERLYIGADGPRPGNADDRDACAAVRALIASADWPCEVSTLYHDENLGCSQAIVRHIDWFFAHEEHGVILEDDCVPHPAFLDFCEALLDRFAADRRVMTISGFTPLAPREALASYWCSIFCLSWGWATWKRAWGLYRPRLEGFDEFLAAGRFPGAAADPVIAARWTGRFRLAQRDPYYSWFVNWTYSCWANDGITLIPNANLVRNVGSALGDKQMPNLPVPDGDLPFGEPDWPLLHPRSMNVDVRLDHELMRRFFHLS